MPDMARRRPEREPTALRCVRPFRRAAYTETLVVTGFRRAAYTETLVAHRALGRLGTEVGTLQGLLEALCFEGRSNKAKGGPGTT